MQKNRISTLLLPWYKENKRDLPWRNTNNPYHIWVSEIMLQQTRVETVIPYFNRFIKDLPTISDLANCNQDVLFKLWEGLGYYSRVSNMQDAAIDCVKNHNGMLPNTVEELKKLKGIGDYTAGAIASIAFNVQTSAIDGNVMRIYSRLYHIDSDIGLNKTKKEFQEYLEYDYNDEMGDFNQALMDFGSMVCTPKNSAKCESCVLQCECISYKIGDVELLPVKINKLKRKYLDYTVIVYRYKDMILINKRDSKGLLANLYQFEMVEGFIYEQYDVVYKHVFTHITWNIQGKLIEVDSLFKKSGFIWVNVELLNSKYTIPTAFKPLLDLL